MELIVSVVFCSVALLIAWSALRSAADRCDRAEGVCHSILSTNRDLVGVITKQSQDAGEQFLRVCNTLVEVGDCAPARAQLELRRMELQCELESERIRRMSQAEAASRSVESLADHHTDHGMNPVSQSTIED